MSRPPRGVRGAWNTSGYLRILSYSRQHWTMRYRRAVEKMGTLAEACEGFKRFPSEEPWEAVEGYLDLLDATE